MNEISELRMLVQLFSNGIIKFISTQTFRIIKQFKIEQFCEDQEFTSFFFYDRQQRLLIIQVDHQNVLIYDMKTMQQRYFRVDKTNELISNIYVTQIKTFDKSQEDKCIVLFQDLDSISYVEMSKKEFNQPVVQMEKYKKNIILKIKGKQKEIFLQNESQEVYIDDTLYFIIITDRSVLFYNFKKQLLLKQVFCEKWEFFNIIEGNILIIPEDREIDSDESSGDEDDFSDDDDEEYEEEDEEEDESFSSESSNQNSNHKKLENNKNENPVDQFFSKKGIKYINYIEECQKLHKQDSYKDYQENNNLGKFQVSHTLYNVNYDLLRHNKLCREITYLDCQGNSKTLEIKKYYY